MAVVVGKADQFLLTIASAVIRQGNQGVLDAASKASLESEFGTSKDEEVVKQILEKGTIIESAVRLQKYTIGCCEGFMLMICAAELWT